MRHRIFPKNKRPRERRSKPLPRAVHIDGQEYRWEHGRNGLKVLAPDNTFYTVPWPTFHGEKEWEIICNTWLCSCDDCRNERSIRGITPSRVKQYIIDNLLAKAAA